MPAHQRSSDPWRCRADYKPPYALIDPRTAIAKHIDWVRPSCNETEFVVPEPDDYNRAIIDTKPRFCDFVSEQVWYWDQYRDGWVSVYWVPQADLAKFDRWLSDVNPLAIWRTWRGKQPRSRRGLLYAARNGRIHSNEVLYSQGYYDYLAKYFSRGDLRLRLPVGEPRAQLQDLLKLSADPDPGELS